MNRSCSFSIRLPLELLDKLERTVSEKKFNSISESIRSYTELGIKVESFKTTIKDPEFLKSIGELKQTDGIFQWTETLTAVQVDAIAYALQMEKEKRDAQRDLR